tara:strand:+ start:5067 stop:5276 length:210 start_codon:yes stop_codon:yes gene_type:complete
MTKITLDDKEYDTVNLTDEQNQIINILNVGTNSVALLDHITQCVRAIQQIKTNELQKSLEDDSQKELDL